LFVFPPLPHVTINATNTASLTTQLQLQITDVSVPRGQSFQDARMTWSDVETALEKATVIFNAAGAHISKLAGPSLALAQATNLPCALNLYVTKAETTLSAPPHTDAQDVLVVQTCGNKAWRVYSPPHPNKRANVSPFARGKMSDRLTERVLQEWDSQLLLECTLAPGDVLFVPAGLPHTTSTKTEGLDETSIHMTLGMDHHIWELDMLSVRRLALQRANLADAFAAVGQTSVPQPDRYEGRVNEIVDKDALFDFYEALPLDLFNDEIDEIVYNNLFEKTLERLITVCTRVESESASES
jgi:Cupin superfamily protein